MKLARVVGSIESTVKHEAYAGAKMMAVQPLSPLLKPAGRAQPAMDTVSAGIGDLVLISDESKTAARLLGVKRVPVRTLIIGIVDEVDARAYEETGRGTDRGRLV